jgi:DNA repair protein RadD
VYEPPAKAIGDMVEIRPLAERVHYYQALVRLARETGHSPGWVAVEFKDQFGYYPKRCEMGDDPTLWTQFDEAMKRRVWVGT